MFASKIAVPIKVHIPGHANITRIATGYAGDYVTIEIDGRAHVIPKSKISSEAHKAINIALRGYRLNGKDSILSR